MISKKSVIAIIQEEILATHEHEIEIAGQIIELEKPIISDSIEFEKNLIEKINQLKTCPEAKNLLQCG